MRKIFTLALIPAIALGGCANLTAQQQANLQLEFALAKQIGVDAVQIWCATSGIVYVIANDVSAQSRVTAALSKNSKAATDACPLIAQVTGVKVVLPGQVTPTAASSTTTSPAAATPATGA